jgi:hypothetical protein
LYSEVKVMFLELLPEPASSGPEQISAILNQSQASPARVNLPKLPVPKFTGHFAHWHDFFTQFNVLIHSNEELNAIQKFLYLQSALSTSAADIINHLPLSEENYSVAIDLLKRRYDNLRRLITHHCAKITELPIIRASSLRDLRAFIDQFNAHHQALSSIPTINIYEAIFVTQLLAKLETPLRAKFEELQHSDAFPRAETLLDFLNNQALQLENVELARPRSAPTSRLNPASRSAHVSANHQRSTMSLISTISPCFISTSTNHKVYSCPSFLKQSPKERYSLIKTLNRCFNCLAQHSAETCPSKGTCRHYQKPHHTLLHFGSTAVTHKPSQHPLQPRTSSTQSSSMLPSGTSRVQPSSPSSEQVSSFISTSPLSFSTVLMATTLVRLQVPSAYIKVRGILDSASMASFISDRCLRSLPCNSSTHSVPRVLAARSPHPRVSVPFP